MPFEQGQWVSFADVTDDLIRAVKTNDEAQISAARTSMLEVFAMLGRRVQWFEEDAAIRRGFLARIREGSTEWLIEPDGERRHMYEVKYMGMSDSPLPNEAEHIAELIEQAKPHD